MPASIDWHSNHNDILLMVISGTVTMNEALDVTIQEGELIKNAEHTIHTIIDLRENEGAPREFLSSLPRLTSMPAVSHPHAGTKIVVGAAGLADTFLRIFSRVYRKLHMVNSMEEAHEILQKQ